MTESREQMAIIQGVGVGLRDVGKPVLWWTVNTGDSGCALQVFNWEEAGEIIKAYGVREVHGLDGKPCWVEIANGCITFKRACIIRPEKP